jgi:glycerophosphoryl diester phosphodiesterase
VEIVAHRGVHDRFPENSFPAFENAVEIGADAFEFDVRLTSDRTPVVAHYIELEKITGARGFLFETTFDELRNRPLIGLTGDDEDAIVPSLHEVLIRFAGRIGLEIEVKGPEPEAAEAVAAALGLFSEHWPSFELTSYEPALLHIAAEACPGLAVDLLFPKSEPWMTADVVAHIAIEKARLARARAVHLHPSQLSPGLLTRADKAGVEVHSWEVNSEEALNLIRDFEIPRFCTDNVESAMTFLKHNHG